MKIYELLMMQRVASDYRGERLQGNLDGISIAVPFRLLEPSLFGRLIV